MPDLRPAMTLRICTGAYSRESYLISIIATRLLTEVAGEPEKIKLSGGILHSRVWTQMCADIFGKEMEIDQSKQSSLMGAVILAREIIGDLKDISDYEPSVKTTVRPDMARNERYRKQFERYLQMYRSMEQE